MSVEHAIRQAITDIEQANGVRVLYAAESGSRAWGFASPDSDYDVRFLYVHPASWYLALEEPRDVIEAMLPGDLDLSGWELRKALRLFKRGNPALNEWLDSPLIYHQQGDLAVHLRELLPMAFRAPAAHHHYLSMARGIHREHFATTRVNLKKAFYVLRPLLACRWIRELGTQPPTPFAELLTPPWVSDGERDMSARLQAAKRTSNESGTQPLDSATRHWFEQELSVAEAATENIPSRASVDTQRLNELLRHCVGEAFPAT